MTTTSTPAALRAGHALDRRDAAVDGHDHGRRVLGEHPPHRLRLQAVAVLEPMRQEGHGVGARAQERRPQLGDRGDAVHVVVAEDDDAPAGARGRARSRSGRLLEALHEERDRGAAPGRGRGIAARLGVVDARARAAAERRARSTPGRGGRARRRARRRRDDAPASARVIDRPRSRTTANAGLRHPSRSRTARARGTSGSGARGAPRRVRSATAREVALDRLSDRRDRAGRVGVRAARRLRDDLVDDAELRSRRP